MDWRCHVVYSTRELLDGRLRLWGGELREAGCLDPGEALLLKDIDVKWARCFATMGRSALFDLAHTLGASLDTRVIHMIKEAPTMYRVYEYCFWEAEQWIDDVQRELTVEPLPDQGIQINYPTLLHWANLSWLCGYSPFDFEFVFETASQKIMSWTGIGDDNCNLQVEIADSTTDIEIALLEWAKRRRIWLYRFAEQEFGSPMPWDVWTDRPHDSAHLVHAPDPGYPGLS